MIPTCFSLRRFSCRDNAYEIIMFTITMHDHKQPWSLTETKDDKALFLLGLIRIIDKSCVWIKEYC